jgi:hypothetical protein
MERNNLPATSIERLGPVLILASILAATGSSLSNRNALVKRQTRDDAEDTRTYGMGYPETAICVPGLARLYLVPHGRFLLWRGRLRAHAKTP